MKLLSSFFFIVLLALQANAQSLQRVAPEQVGMDSRHLLYADEAIETAIANKDIPNEGRIQQAFRFDPKILGALFALALGVADQRVYQLQNVLFRMDVAKRVVAHTLGKVNGIQHFYPVAAPHKELAHLADQTSFRVGNHE